MKRIKIKWGVFFSGGGRCANDCLNLLVNNYFDHHYIDCVVTSGQKTDNIKNFEKHQIEVIDENPKNYSSIEEYQTWLSNVLKDRNIDYLFLLGYKYKIRPTLLAAFPNRILNIHPSLLPAFKNTQTAIQDAIRLGVKVSGVTTHIIDDKIDEGVIIDQEPVRLNHADSFSKIDIAYNEAGKILIERTLRFVHANHDQVNYLQNNIDIQEGLPNSA
ncbi:phosphoribosylglycinamide formyltransferase [Muricauda sp. NFXS6]|uniref:formyltransferase family protein n=1 Tax=Allomuricauda sp. NFXS6 TaxID=2819094 RepID=UPI0032DF9B66